MSITYEIKTVECDCHTGLHHDIAIVAKQPVCQGEQYLDPEVDEALQQAMYGKILSR